MESAKVIFDWQENQLRCSDSNFILGENEDSLVVVAEGTEGTDDGAFYWDIGQCKSKELYSSVFG